MSKDRPEDTKPNRTTSSESGSTRPNRAVKRSSSASAPSPKRIPSGDTRPNPRQPSERGKKLATGNARLVLAILPLIAAFCLLTLASALLGYNSGQNQLRATSTVQARAYLEEQYTLGLQDAQEGRYDLALRRFAYVYQQDPSFQEAADRWVEIMLLLGKTPVSSFGQATALVPTPTIDPRPAEELLAQATGLIAALQWDQAIQTLAGLRNISPSFEIVKVDGMLYLALRNRGVEKILNQGELEGGLYDFALAENFGPLDRQVDIYRGWARLYLLGNAFWLAYPDIAAQYYGQLVGVAPNLRDSSGLTAFYRYWASLVQYGDQLALKGDWCGAAEQYQRAMNARPDSAILPTATYAVGQCLALTPSSTPTTTKTITPTTTGTIPPGTTSPPSATSTPSGTPTPPIGPSNTPTPSPTDTPPGPTDTPTPTPTDTPTPTETPSS